MSIYFLNSLKKKAFFVVVRIEHTKSEVEENLLKKNRMQKNYKSGVERRSKKH